MSKILSNVLNDYDRNTIAIILAVFVPGTGHILMGYTRNGLIIVVAAVLSGLIFPPLIFAIFPPLMGGGLFNDLLLNILATIVPVGIWIGQIMNLRTLVKH